VKANKERPEAFIKSETGYTYRMKGSSLKAEKTLLTPYNMKSLF